MIFLKLYIVNHTDRSKEKVEQFSKILEDHLNGNYQLEVINIMDHLEAAHEDDVLATPTVIKVSPDPPRRIVGDLCNREKILTGLGLLDEREIPA
jgi:circadian clock protein KaiB